MAEAASFGCFVSRRPTRAGTTGAAELAFDSAHGPFSTALGFCFLSRWTPAVDQGPWIGLLLAS